MTDLELIEFVYTKMAGQGHLSKNDEGECLYRGPNGAKCPAGHLISDEEYNPEMEDYACWNYRISDSLANKNVDGWSLRGLQFIHDESKTIEDFLKTKDLIKKVVGKGVSLRTIGRESEDFITYHSFIDFLEGI